MSKKLIGLYPGTFDPVTLGHLDIMKRAVKLVDHLVIGVATNASKTPLFTLDERVAMVKAEAERLAEQAHRGGLGTLAFFVSPAGAAPAPDLLTRACGIVYHASITPPEAVVWATANGNRIVILGVKGDRFECLFDGADKTTPRLLTVETTGADKSVTVLTGKKLDALNQLIQQKLANFKRNSPAPPSS